MKVRGRNHNAGDYGCCLKDDETFSSDGIAIPVDANAIWQMVLAVCKKLIFHVILITFIQRELTGLIITHNSNFAFFALHITGRNHTCPAHVKEGLLHTARQ
ncbi:hypothetical protein LNP20_30195 [Klebsiella pneumoniae subsp. pneumoniae]|nr:hypothetical protein [Klebsiella pneumoniae subsp. pneumoniae]